MPMSAVDQQPPALDRVWHPMEVALNDVNDILRSTRMPMWLNSDCSTLRIASTESKMRWYAHILNAVSMDAGLAQELHDALDAWVDRDFELNLKPAIAQLSRSKDEAQVFHVTCRIYSDVQQLATFASFVFGYLDKVFERRPVIPKVRVLFLTKLHDGVYAETKARVVGVLLERVNQIRRGAGRLTNELLIAARFIGQIGLVRCATVETAQQKFDVDFADRYVESMEEFYKTESATKANSASGAYEYFKWTHDMYLEEDRLVGSLCQTEQEAMRSMIWDRIMRQSFLRTVFVRNRCKSLVRAPSTGVIALLEAERHAELRVIYKMLSKVPNNDGIKLIATEFKSWIRGKATAVVEESGKMRESHPERAILCCLGELHSTLTKAIQEAFDNSSTLQKARSEVFTDILARPIAIDVQVPPRGEWETRNRDPSELICTFLDSLLRNEVKDYAEKERMDDVLDLLAVFFSYVSEKDVFQDIYKAKLAKRLLQTTPDEDLEVAFLQRMQKLLGNGYTHHLNGMLLDRTNAIAVSEEFCAACPDAVAGVSTTIQVLAAGHWPSYKSIRIDLSIEPRFSGTIDAFTEFYKAKHSNRVLSWIHVLSTGTVAIAFPKGNKEVLGSLYQLLILIAADNAGEISAGELAQRIGITSKQLRPHLATMTMSKQFNLLTDRDEPGAPITSLDDQIVLTLNRGFTHKTRKFKLAVPGTSSGSAGGGTRDAAEDKVLVAKRRAATEAALVRIMKSRRTLSIDELHDTVVGQMSQTAFAPPRRFVKECIEDLISRSYLQRGPEGSNTLEYLA